MSICRELLGSFSTVVQPYGSSCTGSIDLENVSSCSRSSTAVQLYGSQAGGIDRAQQRVLGLCSGAVFEIRQLPLHLRPLLPAHADGHLWKRHTVPRQLARGDFHETHRVRVDVHRLVIGLAIENFRSHPQRRPTAGHDCCLMILSYVWVGTCSACASGACACSEPDYDEALGATCEAARLKGQFACGKCLGHNDDKLRSAGCSATHNAAFCNNMTCVPSLFGQCRLLAIWVASSVLCASAKTRACCPQCAPTRMGRLFARPSLHHYHSADPGLEK
jgi:hypothetical protein